MQKQFSFFLLHIVSVRFRHSLALLVISFKTADFQLGKAWTSTGFVKLWSLWDAWTLILFNQYFLPVNAVVLYRFGSKYPQKYYFIYYYVFFQYFGFYTIQYLHLGINRKQMYIYNICETMIHSHKNSRLLTI